MFNLGSLDFILIFYLETDTYILSTSVRDSDLTCFDYYFRLLSLRMMLVSLFCRDSFILMS